MSGSRIALGTSGPLTTSFYVRAGDTLTTPPFYPIGRDGSNPALGTGGSALLQVDRFFDGQNVLNTAASVVSTSPMAFGYTFKGTELVAGLVYRARFVVSYNTSGPNETFPSEPDDFLFVAY